MTGKATLVLTQDASAAGGFVPGDNLYLDHADSGAPEDALVGDLVRIRDLLQFRCCTSSRITRYEGLGEPNRNPASARTMGAM